MNYKVSQQIFSVVLSMVFTLSPPLLYGAQGDIPSSATETGNPTEPAPQSAAALQALVAPIALYPDSLVAQILTASTFPDQVAIAEYWLQENKSLTGSTLMQAVDRQSWDPSVKALTEFPSVLEQHVQESHLDLLARRGLPRSASRCNDRDSDPARAGKSEGQSAIQHANQSGAAIAPGDRDSTRQIRRSSTFRSTTPPSSTARLT